MISKEKTSLFIVIVFLFFSHPVFAKKYIANGPLHSRTQNPIYLESLGQAPSRAAVLKAGQVEYWGDMNYSNMFEYCRTGNDEVYLDMELMRLAFNLKVGLGQRFEAGLEIPFLHFNGGYFDSWIQSFHKTLGFPNGGRDRVPNGQFRYRIIKNGSIVYDVKRLPIGFSDLIFGLKHNIVPETADIPGFAWTYRFKVPSSMVSRGEGSGNFDFSLGAILEKSISRWHFYLNADYIVAVPNRKIEGLTVGPFFAWLTAVEFSVSHPVSLILQLQGSTPYLGGIRNTTWDGVPLDLIFGVSGTHKDLFYGNDFYWKLGFTEDIYPDGPSVDIGAMFTLGLRM